MRSGASIEAGVVMRAIQVPVRSAQFWQVLLHVVLFGGSHCSLPETQPSPQTEVLQSLSLQGVQPVGQQPSLFTHAEMVVYTQAALQAVPVSIAVWQASGAVQLFGHMPVPEVIAVSQVSLQAVSTTPFPQVHVQSMSLLLLHAAGQQPSLIILQAVIPVWVQLAVQVPAFCSASVVQPLLSLQLVGHTPVPEVIVVSQVSPLSTRPLPQQITISVCAQTLLVQASVVHLLPSSH